MQRLSEHMGKAKTTIFVGICLLAGTLRANIGIKPAFVEVNMDEGRPSGMFLISNLSDTEERFRINAVHFSYSESGGLLRSQTGDYSLAQWIRFNPRELTLPPKTQRAVRFAIISREKLTEGEHWAAMELESLAVNEVTSKDEKTGRSVKLKTISTILVPIFGSVGNTAYQGSVQDVQVQVENEFVVLKTLVAATGNGRLGVKGKYEILDASGDLIDSGSIGSAYVLRGTQRWLTRSIQAAIPCDKEYTVKVSFEAAHLEQPLTKEIQVTWPQAPPHVEADTAAAPATQPASEGLENSPKGSTDGDSQTETQGSARSR